MCISPVQQGNNINTGAGNDNVHISKAPGLLGALGLYQVNINGQSQLMTKQQLENTNFNLGAGNDTLVVDSNVTADITANGGSGHDLMIGGSGNDNFNGGSGHDAIFGRNGHDNVQGGSGHDYVSGGNGWDIVGGGSGHDVVSGGNGFDWVSGGSGWDTYLP